MKPVFACAVLLFIATLLSAPCWDPAKGEGHDDRALRYPKPANQWAGLVEGLSMEDVAGEHNPRMIGIWGGKFTRQPWFLRSEHSDDRLFFGLGLRCFQALYGRFPADWNELNRSGLNPIQPLDPVTGQEYCYAVAPKSATDFVNIDLQTSAAAWRATFNVPIFPRGEWVIRTLDLDLRRQSDWNADFRLDLRSDYPNISAMRGIWLAITLDHILVDHVLRRAKMPETAEQLLDCLWTVKQEWATNDSDVDITQPGTFFFGVDKGNEIAVAVWRDRNAGVYWKVYDYSPWPEGGWDSVPSAVQLMNFHNEASYGNEVDWYSQHFELDGYEPDVVLWRCFLFVTE